MDQNVTITIKNIDSSLLEVITAALSPYGTLFKFGGSATDRRIAVNLHPTPQLVGEKRLAWMADVRNAITSVASNACSIEFDWRMPDLAISIDAELPLDCQAAIPIGTEFAIRLPRLLNEESTTATDTSPNFVTLLATMADEALVLWLPDSTGRPAASLTLEYMHGAIFACVAGDMVLAFDDIDVDESQRATSIHSTN